MVNEYLSSSRAGPTGSAWLQRFYREIFGKPLLSCSPKGEMYFEVYKLASERLMEAERAVEDARSAFYRGDGPFDYRINEATVSVGGQDR